MKTILFENAAYRMEMGCGLDVWRIFGRADGTWRCPSTPVSFDKNKETFVTISGNTYKVISYYQNKEEFWQQVEKDVVNGGFETK